MKRLKKLSLVLALLLALAACSTDNVVKKTDEEPVNKVEDKMDDKDDDKDDNLDDKMEDDDQMVASGQGLQGTNEVLSLDEIVGAFYDHFGATDIQIEKISLGEDDGVLAYDIEGYDEMTEYELKLNAKDGQILKEETDSNSPDKDDYGIALDLIVTPAQAMEAALVKSEGSSVREWTLEAEDKGVFYKVEVDSDIEVKVNAETGEVVKVDK